MGHYSLYCHGCRSTVLDDCSNLCSVCGPAGGLLQTHYQEKRFIPLDRKGLWKFANWLPVQKPHSKDHPGSVAYHATTLGRELGLKNLFVGFNGYWPEKGAFMKTGSFKETEAPPTFQRLLEKGKKGLVLSSAGNTAQAFMNCAQDFPLKLVVVVPESALGRLRLPGKLSGNVVLLGVGDGADYLDAIQTAARLSKALDIPSEGGARNVARRDGMGTVALEGALVMGRNPQHYFQAIGSGTGGIAAFEAAERLRKGGSFEEMRMKLHLSQNLPFIPMVTAWKAGSRELPVLDHVEAREQVQTVEAQMLTNRSPPYSVGGGVFFCLTKSKGEMYGVSNEEGVAARKLFEDCEEVDVESEAGVTLGSLLQALEKGTIDTEAYILLNVTGGGRKLAAEELDLQRPEPSMVLEKGLGEEELKRVLKGLV
jgi:cysteate synthase